MKSRIDIIAEIAKLSVGRDELMDELESAKTYGVLTNKDKFRIENSIREENRLIEKLKWVCE